jgi:hypothetical protein
MSNYIEFPLKVGKVYKTKFQVPEPVRILSFLGAHNAYVVYENTPELGKCLLSTSRIQKKRQKITINGR